MKALKSLLLIVSIGVLFTLSNCGSPSPTPEPVADQQLAKLSKTWKITNVKLDGADKTTSYPGFQLIVTGTKGATSFGYTTSGRPLLSAWKSSGTWAFGTDPLTMLVRDPDSTTDKLDMTYTVSESTLTISFNYQGAGYTRTDVVKGAWVFTFGL
ncbi:MAG: hypothetical protein ACKVOQ_11910 [Cyclobacteriaceae bacterium]